MMRLTVFEDVSWSIALQWAFKHRIVALPLFYSFTMFVLLNGLDIALIPKKHTNWFIYICMCFALRRVCVYVWFWYASVTLTSQIHQLSGLYCVVAMEIIPFNIQGRSPVQKQMYSLSHFTLLILQGCSSYGRCSQLMHYYCILRVNTEDRGSVNAGSWVFTKKYQYMEV